MKQTKINKKVKEFIDKRSNEVLSSIKKIIIENNNLKIYYDDPVIFNTVEEVWPLGEII